ncbi:MAG: hypothetical protein V4732_16485 [Pseudomonadota bacterium]
MSPRKLFPAALIFLWLQSASVVYGATCTRLPDVVRSSATSEGVVSLPWRTDYPQKKADSKYKWESIDPQQNWEKYLEAVLSEIRASGLHITDGRIKMPPDAQWWIAPWMDYGANGREMINGLTRERGPEKNDLAPGSQDTFQVWAIGWFNTEGALSLGDVFSDPCNPDIPEMGWKFQEKTMSFKLLFTDATNISYLNGAPKVEAAIYPSDDPRSNDIKKRAKRTLQLFQIDVAIRDEKKASDTEWIMGTFIWKGPARGDGLIDNFVPVGLSWGDDPQKLGAQWSSSLTLSQTAINSDLAGVVWQKDKEWPHRPFAGFQGRLNGPADNQRSSCISCHGLAQWPRSSELNILPRYEVGKKIDADLPPLTEDEIKALVGKYFINVRGGSLNNSSLLERPTNGEKKKPAIPLDYSLQLEAGLSRMCQACDVGHLVGPVPKLCRPEFGGRLDKKQCGKTIPEAIKSFFGFPNVQEFGMPRQ